MVSINYQRLSVYVLNLTALLHECYRLMTNLNIPHDDQLDWLSVMFPKMLYNGSAVPIVTTTTFIASAMDLTNKDRSCEARTTILSRCWTSP